MSNSSDQIERSPPLAGQPSLSSQCTTGIPASDLIYSKWSSGLCDCCSDVSNCCTTYWCPCITFGKVAEIVDKGTSSFHQQAILYYILCELSGCHWVYSTMYRSKIRQQYMLPEEPCNDCLVHFCCESLALCQEYRELKHRGFDMSLGWHKNMERRNQGVMMAPSTYEEMKR